YLPKNKDKVKGEVVAIYPKEGTFWSDHPIGLVNRDWVTKDHKGACEKYVKFLMNPDQQKKAVQFGFRPGLESVPVESPLDRKHGVDPDNEPKSTLEVPSAEVMEAVVGLWKKNKKPSRIVLVIDTSGSMNDDDRLKQCKTGALELLNLLSERDTLSLMVFNNTVVWKEKDVTTDRAGKEKLQAQIKRLIAQGQTALYDAIAQASEYLDEKPQADRISAVVCLTDGEDNKSKLTLDKLKA